MICKGYVIQRAIVVKPGYYSYPQCRYRGETIDQQTSKKNTVIATLEVVNPTRCIETL